METFAVIKWLRFNAEFVTDGQRNLPGCTVSNAGGGGCHTAGAEALMEREGSHGYREKCKIIKISLWLFIDFPILIIQKKKEEHIDSS